MASHLFGVIDVEVSTIEKASAWEDWAKSHSENVVIIDDSRESIYAENE